MQLIPTHAMSLWHVDTELAKSELTMSCIVSSAFATELTMCTELTMSYIPLVIIYMVVCYIEHRTQNVLHSSLVIIYMVVCYKCIIVFPDSSSSVLFVMVLSTSLWVSFLSHHTSIFWQLHVVTELFVLQSDWTVSKVPACMRFGCFRNAW